MKHINNLIILFTIAFTGLFVNNIFSNAHVDAELKKQVEGFIAQKPLGFQENKGQVAVNNLPASFVLFKAEVPNLTMWVTNTGLTYQFFTIDKELITNAEEEEEVEQKMRWNRVDMVLKGASIKKENIITQGDITQGMVSYYLGHCPDGIFNVKTYTKVTIKEVYPGIDWVLYTSQGGGIKQDFVVHPGADASQLKLIYEGTGDFNVTNNRIHFKNTLGEITEGELLCYQGDERTVVQSGYSVKQNTAPLYKGAGNIALENELTAYQNTAGVFSYEVEVALGSYNKSEALVIDPELFWSTFFGGNVNDAGHSLTTDASGNLFVTGNTTSANFPIQNWGGAYNQSTGSFSLLQVPDLLILKFSPAGVLEWSTFYGGTNEDAGHSVAVDINGNIFITGFTSSPDLPTQNWAGAYNQPIHAGGVTDAFIIKFLANGSRQWATFYGGGLRDAANSVTADNNGNIYITGWTRSAANFPLQNRAGAYNQTYGGGIDDVFIVKFLSNGARDWATCYGGTLNEQANSITTDNSGNVFVTGKTRSLNFPLQNLAGSYNQSTHATGNYDAFILKFDANGARTWATYYGGSGVDEGHTVITDNAGSLYLVGQTASTNIATQNKAGAYNQPANAGGANDVFLLKFLSNGTYQWGTYYGSAANESVLRENNIAVDGCGNLYLTITTSAGNMPLHVSSCGYDDNTYNGNNGGGAWASYAGDMYITCFSADGAIIWDTYFGGDAPDQTSAIALDKDGNLYVTGNWSDETGVLLTSSTYPTINPGNGAYFDNTHNSRHDCFIAKFIPSPPATLTKTQIDGSGCGACDASATIEVNCGNPNYSYVWSNGSAVPNSISNLNTVSGLCPGVYTVSVTSTIDIPNVLNGCALTHTDTASFTFGGAVTSTISISGDTIICTDSSTVLTASGANTYTWFPAIGLSNTTGASVIAAPSVTTTYTVVGIDANGCEITKPVLITVNTQMPAPSITGIQNICEGQNTVLSASGGVAYIWNTGASTQTITVSPTTTTTYQLFAHNSCGTVADSITVTVYPAPAISFEANRQQGCGPLCVILTNTTPNVQAVAWNFGDGSPNDNTNPVEHCYTIPGNYPVSLTVTDNNGCSNTRIEDNYITVYPNPVAAFVANPQPATILNSTVLFSDASVNAASWNWTFGDVINATSNLQNPAYTYGDTGTYQVQLIVESDFGCKDTTEQLIRINAEYILYVPNTFTPNGDGKNDTFMPLGMGVDAEQYKCSVFDRWGNLVFESLSPDIGWDGRANGGKDIAQIDTYIWKITLTDLQGTNHRYVGQINLLK